MAVSENALRFNELNIVGKVVSQPVTEDDGITTFQLYQESSSLSIRVVVFEPNSIQLGETLIVKGKLAYDVQGQELAMGASTIFTVEGVPLKHVPTPAQTLRIQEEETVNVAIEVENTSIPETVEQPATIKEQVEVKQEVVSIPQASEESAVDSSENQKLVEEKELDTEKPVIEVGLPPLSGDTQKVKEEVTVPSVEETTPEPVLDSVPVVEQPEPVQSAGTFKTILKVSSHTASTPSAEPVHEEPKVAEQVAAPVVEKEQPKPVETSQTKPVETSQTKPVETPQTKPVETPQTKPVEPEPVKKEEDKGETKESQEQSNRPSRFSVSDFNC